MTYYKLAIAAALPPIMALVFSILEKRSRRFASLSYAAKQVIIGLCFASLAILGTELGEPVLGAVINIRSAAPLTAGLLFGGPAGIISGVIGGIYRWVSAYWDNSYFTQLGCTLATIAAGFLGAGCHNLLKDNRRRAWIFSLVIGVACEVMHMLLIFVTNIISINTAFSIIQTSAPIMIVGNTLSVTLATVFYGIVNGDLVKVKGEKSSIAQIFQSGLLGCVGVSFFATAMFTFLLQNTIASMEVLQVLVQDTSALVSGTESVINRTVMQGAGTIALNYDVRLAEGEADPNELALTVQKENSLRDIYVTDSQGVIIGSSKELMMGRNISDTFPDHAIVLSAQGLDPYQYCMMLEDEMGIVHASCPYSGGMILVSFTPRYISSVVEAYIALAARDRSVGNSGFTVVADTNGKILSITYDDIYGNISKMGFDVRRLNHATVERKTISGTEYFCLSWPYETMSEEFIVFGFYPVSEAMLSRNMSIYVTLFMESVVFTMLFVLFYFLVRKTVLNNLREVNSSLAKITAGELNTTVNVRDNLEFEQLSNDINATVSTLRHYIAEAAARLDKELMLAESIQRSALPGVFPPFPKRNEFAIFANMDPAKEVGGDFYDFYLLGDNKLAFLVADVSGKGIPAAMFMMTAKTLIKGLAESGLEVDEVFTRANQELCTNNETGMFVTAWMGILDTNTGVISYANAGHNPPFVYRKGDGFSMHRTRPNFILAGMEGVKYKKHEIQLQPGDKLFLYTDGVTEAQNLEQELYGEDRLLDALNDNGVFDTEEICRSVKASVESFVGEADQFDDLTTLCIEYCRGSSSTTLRYTPSMEQLPKLSEFLEQELEKIGASPKKSISLMIALDEIASNIARYSGADSATLTVGLEEGIIKLMFTDNGIPYDPLQHREPDTTLDAEEREIGGLGIFIVRKKMDSMQYEYVGGKNVLTLTLSL